MLLIKDNYITYAAAMRLIQYSSIYVCMNAENSVTFMIICWSRQIFLLLTEAFAEIDGPSEKFIKAGSALVLNCTFKRLTEKPAFVFW